MGISIGSNNTFQGNINMGDNAKQVAKDFNQEFNDISKLLELIKNDLVEKYDKDDKEEVLNDYDDFQKEVIKPLEQRDNSLVKSKMGKLSKAFSFISNTSSIAGLILAIIQAI
ncbi:hypothetical protein [Clostridium butyricum]|nr:hypothetical protein [Clostridium butyricum]AXB86045.1 hypothetical protein DRB99_14000 [Clostridium butyricum]